MSDVNVKTYSKVMAIVAVVLTVLTAVSIVMRSGRGNGVSSTPKVESVKSSVSGMQDNNVTAQQVTLPATKLDQKVKIK